MVSVGRNITVVNPNVVGLFYSIVMLDIACDGNRSRLLYAWEKLTDANGITIVCKDL